MQNKLLDQNINRIWASLIIDELVKNKITQFYLSPGMRNAPLIAAMNHLQTFYPFLEIILCIDERSASYRALGYSKAKGKPSVLICTSGTAMANYFPAVIEAKKSNIPLVIISADRPTEMTNCDDNQTIDQTKFYGEFIQGELNFGAPSIDISPLALTSSLSNLIHKAIYPQKGPVHFNSPFREPLENTFVDIPSEYKNLANTLINKTTPTTQYLDLQTRLSSEALKIIANQINNSKNGIVVIGALAPSENHREIKNFVNKLNWKTYFDVSSSLKYSYHLGNNTDSVESFPTFDHPEVQEVLLKNPPDTIIHIGGRLTSKHYYTFLKQIPEINLITINHSIEKEDPSHHTKIRLNVDIVPTLQDLLNLITPLPKKDKFSISFEKFAAEKISLIDQGPLSYPKISKTVIDHIKDNSIIYLGNSTVVRSFDSYFSFQNTKNITVATNRGVSGIEGLISSAIGLIDGLKKECILVLGDISFLHDLNAIYYLNELKTPLKIILINNFSGGIFTLLPIQKEENVLKYVSSPHSNKFEMIAKIANITYDCVNDENVLLEKFNKLQNANEHYLLEIFVDNDTNKNVYDLLKTIKL